MQPAKQQTASLQGEETCATLQGAQRVSGETALVRTKDEKQQAPRDRAAAMFGSVSVTHSRVGGSQKRR